MRKSFKIQNLTKQPDKILKQKLDHFFKKDNQILKVHTNKMLIFKISKTTN